MFFNLGIAMQLVGFAIVGFCLFAGLTRGEYGKVELIQLIGGSLLFYIGTIFKNKGTK